MLIVTGYCKENLKIHTGFLSSLPSLTFLSFPPSFPLLPSHPFPSPLSLEVDPLKCS